MCKMGTPHHIIIMLKAIREQLGVKREGEVFVIDPKTWVVAYRGPVAGAQAAIDQVMAGKVTTTTRAAMNDGKAIAFPEQERAADVLEDWPARRRGHLLTADLADLGVAPARPIKPPPFDTPAALLGGLYVLEGSRLGGAVLRRRLPPGSPSRFLSAPAPNASWSRLLALLERELGRESDLAAAVAAAQAVFGSFERAGKTDLERRLGR